MEQRGDSRKEQDLGCVHDAAAPQNPVCLRFQWLLWQHVVVYCNAAAKPFFDSNPRRLVRIAGF